MTLNDIAAMDKDFLTPDEVAGVLTCAPQLIRDQVDTNPELIGFHFCKIGNRIKIPRLAFIDWFCSTGHDKQIIDFNDTQHKTRFVRKPNDYLVFDDHAEIVLTDRNGNDNCHALIDLDDVERCKPFRWCKDNRYISTRYDGKHISLHHFIMNYFGDELCIDHINHNTFDNRKQNLRIVTYSVNSQNRSLRDDAGIVRDKDKWRVDIHRNKVRYNVGRFNTIEEALKAKKKFLKDNGLE